MEVQTAASGEVNKHWRECKQHRCASFILAFTLVPAAVCGVAAQNRISSSDAMQNSAPRKANAAPGRESNGASATTAAKSNSVTYGYEFTQPQFVESKIEIKHDPTGKGTLSFLRRDADEAITEEIQVSPAALERVKGLWSKLDFLNSQTNYQSQKQFPHLGTIKLEMREGERARTTEFNWTQHPEANALATEYRRIADQQLFIFDLAVARQNQPLEAPGLMNRLDTLLRRQGLSDPAQLVPLLRDLSTDERVPLIARNQATKLIKKIEK